MADLILNDRIYGSVPISEPVLLEVLISKPIERLKHINQHGPLEQSQPQLGLISRFEHSVGVMLLLRRYGASLGEQIAGLLHDVGHTAFSHVVDYAIGDDSTQEFNDEAEEQIVMDSEIPKILERHGFTTAVILNKKNYPLLEQTEPEMCADRIDYLLRDTLFAFRLVDQPRITQHLAGLQARDGRWFFSSIEHANDFARDFLLAAENGWYTPTNLAAFHTLGEAIRIALDQGYINHADLFGTDNELYRQLQQTGDQRILDLLHTLENLKASFDPHTYTVIRNPKLRIVDPLFEQDGKLLRLSEHHPSFKERLASHTTFITNGMPVRIE